MSSKAAQLMRETESEVEDIECVECGRSCPIDTDICPHCGQIAKLIPLKELGRKLPIGLLDEIDDEEILRKEFDIGKIDWEVERKISDTWKKVLKQSNVSSLDHLICVLVHTVTDLGKMDFTQFKEERRLAILNSMFGGDIFYMYTWARIASLGDVFTVKDIECGSCHHEFDFPVDLSTLDVGVRTNPKNLYKTVELRDGFEVSGVVRKSVTLRPATFMALAHAPNQNEAEMFRSMLKDVVVGIDGMIEGATIDDDDVAKLSKWDMSILANEVDVIAGGPEWNVEGLCPKCKTPFNYDIDWKYSNFFNQSSRSKRRRRQLRK